MDLASGANVPPNKQAVDRLLDRWLEAGNRHLKATKSYNSARPKCISAIAPPMVGRYAAGQAYLAAQGRVFVPSDTMAAFRAWLEVRGHGAGAVFGPAVHDGRVGERQLADERVAGIRAIGRRLA